MTKRRKRIILLIVLGVVLASFITLSIINLVMPQTSKVSEVLSLIVNLFSTLGVVTSIVFTGISFADNNDAQLASFVQSLNDNFIKNEANVKVYNALAACHHDKCKDCEKCKKDPNYKCIRADEFDDEIYLSNYLTFFGTIYVLLKREVIQMDFVNELFSFRFFVAAHSKLMQDERLHNPEFNFKDIVVLEEKWLAHKIKQGEFSQSDLDKAVEDYRKVRSGEMTELEANENHPKIALRRPLRSMYKTDEEYHAYLGY